MLNAAKQPNDSGTEIVLIGFAVMKLASFQEKIQWSFEG